MFAAGLIGLASVVGVAGCGSSSPPGGYPKAGPVAGPAGAGSFTFGVATAAAQIEEDNVHSNWWIWSERTDDGGLGKGKAFVGDAVKGYEKALTDVDLIEAMHLDAYRFNPSWARIEPEEGVFDEAALAHYDALIDKLVASGIKPMLTVHHFANPVWVDDPRDPGCSAGPSATNRCGWNGPDADRIIADLAAYAGKLAARYGDRVDEWATVNEPINYLVASYGVGFFPPGKGLLFTDFPAFVGVMRNFIRAHVAIYEAIKANDTVDADGDGVAAAVGFTLNVADWVPANDGKPSTDPVDVAATDRVIYVYHHLFVDSLRAGAFDADLDMEPEEPHPDWKDKLDWLGVQYYFRAGVTGHGPILLPGIDGLPCVAGIVPPGSGPCLPPEDPTHWIPEMAYEYYEPGLYTVLDDFGKRWPDLPLTVTESGVATEVGARRAEHIVRSLEQIDRARAEGVDVRGYYHWSLMDNFEWAEGFGPRFGLYSVDRDTYARTPTEGATVLGEIAGAREITAAQHETYGGLGPMTPEPGEPAAGAAP